MIQRCRNQSKRDDAATTQSVENILVCTFTCQGALSKHIYNIFCHVQTLISY